MNKHVISVWNNIATFWLAAISYQSNIEYTNMTCTKTSLQTFHLNTSDINVYVIKKDQNIYKTRVLVHHYYYIIFFWNNENRTKKRCHGINKGNHECIAAHHDNYCYWNVLYVCGLYCFFFHSLIIYTYRCVGIKRGVLQRPFLSIFFTAIISIKKRHHWVNWTKHDILM